MAAKRNYHDQVTVDNNLKLREHLKQLPKFAAAYFRAIEPTTSSRTRIAYAYDLGIFFHYIKENNPQYKDIPVTEFPLSILDEINAQDIEEYMEYLKVYQKDSDERTNENPGIKRKVASLRSFYRYFYTKEMIKTNPASIVVMPKIHEKEIIRFDVDEIAKFLDEVESGEKLTKQQKAFHEKTKVRDVALMTLMLGTGIRVSECVGIDMNDIDFNHSGIKIRRKGGYEFVVYFGDEVEKVLLNYLEERKKIMAAPGHEDALFLSIQNTRLSVRSVEKMVKKYAQNVTAAKHITPHKLRSTYGTELYRETGDIYLVADVLGHKDVNTTRKHYAAIEEERRWSARNKVKLREE